MATLTAQRPSDVATPAPGAEASGSRAPRRMSGVRISAQQTTIVRDTATRSARARPSTGVRLGSSGVGGASLARPTSTRRSATASPRASGSIPNQAHPSQRVMGSWRLPARASASTEATSAGRISAAARSASAQPGTTPPPASTYECGPWAGRAWAASRAETTRSADRPSSP